VSFCSVLNLLTLLNTQRGELKSIFGPEQANKLRRMSWLAA
jgi:hypothetical protein